MRRLSPDILDYYDEEVSLLISEKYGFDHMEAIRCFLKSKTYAMLEDADLEMWSFGPQGIFDMWENEQVTGDPRTSLYLRGDEIGCAD